MRLNPNFNTQWQEMVARLKRLNQATSEAPIARKLIKDGDLNRDGTSTADEVKTYLERLGSPQNVFTLYPNISEKGKAAVRTLYDLYVKKPWKTIQKYLP